MAVIDDNVVRQLLELLMRVAQGADEFFSGGPRFPKPSTGLDIRWAPPTVVDTTTGNPVPFSQTSPGSGMTGERVSVPLFRFAPGVVTDVENVLPSSDTLPYSLDIPPGVQQQLRQMAVGNYVILPSMPMNPDVPESVAAWEREFIRLNKRPPKDSDFELYTRNVVRAGLGTEAQKALLGESGKAESKTGTPKVVSAGRPADPGGPGDTDWRKRFYDVHGRYPNEEDYQDKLWSEWFTRTHGFPPSQWDWEHHWYTSRGLPDPRIPQSAQAAPAESQPTVADLAGGLQFKPIREAMPTYLRDWVQYLQQTIQSNPNVEIPNPFAVTVGEGGEATPFQKQQQEIAQQLGLSLSPDTDYLKGWQQVLDRLPYAPFETQQKLTGLRWDEDKGWHYVTVPQLRNPREL